jgi:hypothetical protein
MAPRLGADSNVARVMAFVSAWSFISILSL